MDELELSVATALAEARRSSSNGAAWGSGPPARSNAGARSGAGGKRSSSGAGAVKAEDQDDDLYLPGGSKRPKVAVDSVEAADLAGNLFLRVDGTGRPNALLTFDGDPGRPLFFEEREAGAVEIPAAALGPAAADPLHALRLPGVEVVMPDGSRRVATVAELMTYLRWVFTGGEDPGPDACVRSALRGGSLAPLPVLMLIRCDEAPAWLSFDVDTLKPKAVIFKGGRMLEVSPQQHEMDAGCHARKWRNSFKVQAALKVIRQGVLTPAPYVELQSFMQRLLGLDGSGDGGRGAARALNREGSGGLSSGGGSGGRGGGGGARGASPGPGSARGGGAAAANGAAAAAAAAAALLPPRPGSAAGRAAMPLGLPLGLPVALPLAGGGAVAAAAALDALGPLVPAAAAAAAAAGPLTTAELQAIHAVVALADGPKLQWAVQGILGHVWATRSCGGGGTAAAGDSGATGAVRLESEGGGTGAPGSPAGGSSGSGEGDAAVVAGGVVPLAAMAAVAADGCSGGDLTPLLQAVAASALVM